MVNGKRSWISTNEMTAIWYNPSAIDWMFGSVENIGKNVGLIHSDYNDENSVCPQDVPLNKWKWYSNKTWHTANGSDIQIQCQNKGNKPQIFCSTHKCNLLFTNQNLSFFMTVVKSNGELGFYS